FGNDDRVLVKECIEEDWFCIFVDDGTDVAVLDNEVLEWCRKKSAILSCRIYAEKRCHVAEEFFFPLEHACKQKIMCSALEYDKKITVIIEMDTNHEIIRE